jgi:hypothetical protein
MDLGPYRCYSFIRRSYSDKSTKLVELVNNKHLSSISYMKLGYVGTNNRCFMIANNWLTPKLHCNDFILQWKTYHDYGSYMR